MTSPRKRKKIVFVVGAGASKEFGLPTGKGLLDSISFLASINSRQDGNTDRFQLDPKLSDAIFQLASATVEHNVDLGSRLFKLKEKAAWLSRIVLLSPSIDNVLHTHQGDPDIVDIGKIMIMQSLLAAEQSSLIANEIERGQTTAMFKFSSYREGRPQYVSETWLGELFRLLVELRNFDQFLEALSDITFICFNYDRCIEHFLTSCAAAYFRLDTEKAKTVLEKVNVIRPYGTLGELTVQSGLVCGFGIESNNLASDSKRIRTFTEQIDNTIFGQKIESAFSCPDIVFFLGFGFLDLNLELLFRNGPFDAQRVLGTHLGMSEDSAVIIEKKLIDSLLYGSDNPQLRQAKLGYPMYEKVKLENMASRDLLAKHQMFLRS